ncbi:MAG: nitrous oxide reductase accessory protein NosL [Desulfobacterales bacterium]|nr:nitrous oxide reductase accessory protein NosL [Desulfobacterales bacterium]
MRKGLIVCSLILVSGLFLFTSVQAGEQKWCPLCSMNLKMFWKTTNWLTFSDGSRTGYCSIHCASKVYQKRATDIGRWEVADYDTKRLINAYKAHFLIGSDLAGTMTAVSKLAFASLDVAKRYQKEHGGTIGTLDDGLRRAIEGRGEDMAMIKKKVAKMPAMGKKLAGKHGCYKCHGEGGTGGAAIDWNTKEFAKSMDNRVKIKKAIMGGTEKMEGYEGKLGEKELHAITIYVWTQRAK